MSSQQISPATVGGLPRPVIVPGVPQNGEQAMQMGAAATQKHQALLNASTGKTTSLQKGGKKYRKRITRGRKSKSSRRNKKGGAFPPTSNVPPGRVEVPQAGSGVVQLQSQQSTNATAASLLQAQSQAKNDSLAPPAPPLPGKPVSGGNGMKGGKSRRRRYKKSIARKSRSRKHRKTNAKRRR